MGVRGRGREMYDLIDARHLVDVVHRTRARSVGSLGGGSESGSTGRRQRRLADTLDIRTLTGEAIGEAGVSSKIVVTSETGLKEVFVSRRSWGVDEGVGGHGIVYRVRARSGGGSGGGGESDSAGRRWGRQADTRGVRTLAGEAIGKAGVSSESVVASEIGVASEAGLEVGANEVVVSWVGCDVDEGFGGSNRHGSTGRWSEAI